MKELPGVSGFPSQLRQELLEGEETLQLSFPCSQEGAQGSHITFAHEVGHDSAMVGRRLHQQKMREANRNLRPHPTRLVTQIKMPSLRAQGSTAPCDSLRPSVSHVL